MTNPSFSFSTPPPRSSCPPSIHPNRRFSAANRYPLPPICQSVGRLGYLLRFYQHQCRHSNYRVNPPSFPIPHKLALWSSPAKFVPPSREINPDMGPQVALPAKLPYPPLAPRLCCLHETPAQRVKGGSTDALLLHCPLFGLFQAFFFFFNVTCVDCLPVSYDPGPRSAPMPGPVRMPTAQTADVALPPPQCLRLLTYTHRVMSIQRQWVKNR